jgi:hypothetical protein
VQQVPPRQTWLFGQVPQLSVLPQPSGKVSQLTPCAAQVVGAQQLPLTHSWPGGQQYWPHAMAPFGQHNPLMQVCPEEHAKA